MALKILKMVKEEKKIHKVRTEIVKQRQRNMDQNHMRIILKCLLLILQIKITLKINYGCIIIRAKAEKKMK